MTYHVVPVDDLIDHDEDGDSCLCGPTDTPIERDDGSVTWLTVHHALDGRE